MYVELVYFLQGDFKSSHHAVLSSDKPAIVINAHKTSRLHGELVDDHERTRRFPVTGTMQQTETLAKLGFDVDLCAKVLVHYAGLIERHLGARNPLRRLFFVLRIPHGIPMEFP